MQLLDHVVKSKEEKEIYIQNQIRSMQWPVGEIWYAPAFDDLFVVYRDYARLDGYLNALLVTDTENIDSIHHILECIPSLSTKMGKIKSKKLGVFYIGSFYEEGRDGISSFFK